MAKIEEQRIEKPDREDIDINEPECEECEEEH